MDYSISVKGMQVDMLNDRTIFSVEIIEDIGIATRVRDTLTITLERKFTGIDASAIEALEEFIKTHKSALGLE